MGNAISDVIKYFIVLLIGVGIGYFYMQSKNGELQTMIGDLKAEVEQHAEAAKTAADNLAKTEADLEDKSGMVDEATAKVEELGAQIEDQLKKITDLEKRLTDSDTQSQN